MEINGEYVKGNIYFDKSFKDMYWGRPRNHNEYRADVSYSGKRYRKRSKNREECVAFLLELKQGHPEEYLKTCEMCGSSFEIGAHGAHKRFCSPACRNKAMKLKLTMGPGMRVIDEKGRTLLRRKERGGY